MEERELPAGWVEVPLAELIDRIEAGKNFRCIERPPLNGEIGVVKVSAVSWGRFREEESKTVPPGIELDPETRICDGDLLFSRANTIELVGACVLVESLTKDLRLSDKILRLVTSDESIKPWIYRYLSSPEARKYLSETSSGNQLSMRNISQRVLLETMVPVAPLNEQRRIAAKLDTTLATVESCRQRLDGVAELLKRFRQAVLAAATSGELTREWRQKRGIDESWEDQFLGNLLSDLRYGTAQKCTYEVCGKPVLRIPNILEGSISHSDLKYAEFGEEEIDKLGIRAGDLLVIRSNGSLDLVGRTALALEADEGFLFAGYLIRLRPKQEIVVPGFLLLVLLSPETRRRIELAARSTSGVNNINSKFLSGLQLGLPSLEEQHEIVRRAQDLFILADQLEARLHSVRKLVDRLTPALLAKAFRGELVPQDPCDEPASVLLERLRAARQAEAAAGKPSRRGRKPAAAHPDQVSLGLESQPPAVASDPLPPDPLPPDQLAQLLQECGPLSEKALLAASELEPGRFLRQLQLELQAGTIREDLEEGERVLVGG